MTYQKIQFMDRSSMHYKKPENDAIVISISNPGLNDASLQEGFKDVLFMKFDNTEHLSHNSVRFSRDHANQIMTFVKQYENEASTIYVNCLMGESRSAAVADFLAKHYNLPMTQDVSKKSAWIYNVLEKVNRLVLKP